jgi:hypothetical protein
LKFKTLLPFLISYFFVLFLICLHLFLLFICCYRVTPFRFCDIQWTRPIFLTITYCQHLPLQG